MLKITLVNGQIEQLMNQHEQIRTNYHLVSSIKGIGLILSAYLVVYTHNFSRFDNWRQLACFTGTAPFEKSSGKKQLRARVGKIGCKTLKALLTNAARCAIRFDKEIAAYANKKVLEGKHTFTIENAVKNKLLARTMAVVSRGTPYVELTRY